MINRLSTTDIDKEMLKRKTNSKLVYKVVVCGFIVMCVYLLLSIHIDHGTLFTKTVLNSWRKADERILTYTTNVTKQNTEVSRKILLSIKPVKVSERKLLISHSSTTEKTTTFEPFVRKCGQKQRNVAFLKVHKAGSTTVMNIFLRFATSNDLNIVLPNRIDGFGFNYLGYGKSVYAENIVPIPTNETYNILCNHVVYNREAFRKIMPKDSVYVGIVREPTSQFVSAALYYGFYRQLLNRAKNYTNARHPTEIFHEFFTHQYRYPNLQTFYVRNRMSYDFGLPISRFGDSAYIQFFLENLEQDFKLIMIMEMFSESLVLMKRYLCWDLQDILYVPLNENKVKTRNPVRMYPSDQQLLRLWNAADFQLYDRFKQKFLEQVNDEGPSFQNEVDNFKMIQKDVQDFCFQNGNSTENPHLRIDRSAWNSEFIVTLTNCDEMMISEVHLLQVLIKRARNRYSSWTKSQERTVYEEKEATQTVL